MKVSQAPHIKLQSHPSAVAASQFGWINQCFQLASLDIVNGMFSMNWPHWADTVIESPCPCVWMCVCLFAPLHYGVEMGQVAQVFFLIEIGTIQLD